MCTASTNRICLLIPNDCGGTVQTSKPCSTAVKHAAAAETSLSALPQERWLEGDVDYVPVAGGGSCSSGGDESQREQKPSLPGSETERQQEAGAVSAAEGSELSISRAKVLPCY